MIGIIVVSILAGWFSAGVGVAVVWSRMAALRDREPEVVPAETLALRDLSTR